MMPGKDYKAVISPQASDNSTEIRLFHTSEAVVKHLFREWVEYHRNERRTLFATATLYRFQPEHVTRPWLIIDHVANTADTPIPAPKP